MIKILIGVVIGWFLRKLFEEDKDGGWSAWASFKNLSSK